MDGGMNGGGNSHDFDENHHITDRTGKEEVSEEYEDRSRTFE